MAVYDNQKVLNALGSHSKVIDEAYRSNTMTIEDSLDNATAIRSLRAVRLVWQMEGEDGYHLRHELLNLLDFAAQDYRRAVANETIAAQWLALKQSFEDLRQARRIGAFDDVRRVERDISESVALLMENLQYMILSFNNHLYNRFTHITDLSLRIQENERVVERARKLAELLTSFSIGEFGEEAGNDRFLRKLLNKQLPSAMKTYVADLSHSLYQLRDLLLDLRESHRLTSLVSSFEAYYQANPGFVPSVEDVELSRCPDAVLLAPAMTIWAYPDIHDPLSDEVLAPIAAGARDDQKEIVISENRTELVPIDMDPAGHTQADERDPVAELIESVVDMILAGEFKNNVIRGSEILQTFDLDIELLDWLSLLSAAVDGLPGQERKQIKMHFVGDVDTIYPDNLWVRDLHLQWGS
ncbi:hypothetical protein [Saccharospirillum sp.]|uniref:hypothetical protein n=1 Tax=Saccharospirillum sp. TaxID=2033801 RepID=UPI0034A09E8B